MARGLGRRGFIAGSAAAALPVRAFAQQPKPVRLGILNDQSGLVADLSGAGTVMAARMAVEDYGGKVLGRPIEILTFDHQNKNDLGLGVARQWYDEGVNAIFDIGISTLALAIQTLAREKGKLVVFISSSSSDLTRQACSPNGIAWTYDNFSQSQGVIRQILAGKGLSWYFLTVDYAYGRAVQRDATAMIEAGGGKVVGAVTHPWDTKDYSSYLLQAQGSGAQVIGLATTTGHALNILKQSDEFGIRERGQKLAPLSLTLHDVKALGLKSGQGLFVTTPYYWDQTDETRAFAKRFQPRFGRMPDFCQATAYGAITHYLKALDKAGNEETDKVAAIMKATPVDDFMTKSGRVRDDGRTLRDMYVFQVKSPADSKGEWDLFAPVSRIPAEEAFLPADPKLCPLVKV